MSGRLLGPGTLRKVKRGNGPERWVLTWTDAQGQRHREGLSTDRRVAEQRRIEIIRQRDMELSGLAAVEGMNTPLAELRDLYLADLATRVVPAHVKNTTAALDRMLREVKAARVRDLRAIDVLQARARAAHARAGARAGGRRARIPVARAPATAGAHHERDARVRPVARRRQHRSRRRARPQARHPRA
jgi:hypothetical protein